MPWNMNTRINRAQATQQEIDQALAELDEEIIIQSIDP